MKLGHAQNNAMQHRWNHLQSVGGEWKLKLEAKTTPGCGMRSEVTNARSRVLPTLHTTSTDTPAENKRLVRHQSLA